MIDLFKEGGYPMWFLLVAAVTTLAAAGRFALGPTRHRLKLTGALATTTLAAILTGTAADVAAVGHRAPDYLADHTHLKLSTVLFEGLSESMSPAILGFSSLAIASGLVSVGVFRTPDEME